MVAMTSAKVYFNFVCCAVLLAFCHLSGTGVASALSQCESETKSIYETEALSRAFSAYMNSYMDSCQTLDLCTIKIDEALLRDPESVLRKPQPVEIDAKFSMAPFRNDVKSLLYERQCMGVTVASGGGSVECVDAVIYIKGAMAPLEDMPVDVQVVVESFPTCLPASCEAAVREQSLKDVMEVLVKERIKQDQDVARFLESNNIDSRTLDAITFNTLCSGMKLEDCTFMVKPVSCEINNNDIKPTGGDIINPTSDDMLSDDLTDNSPTRPMSAIISDPDSSSSQRKTLLYAVGYSIASILFYMLQ